MEYEQMKMAGQKLNELPQAEREFFWVETLVEKSLLVRYPEVCLDDLQAAWQAVLRQATLRQNHRIGREELSVREHMGIILRQLGLEAVVHFLALLELAREKLIQITQTEAFQPIYVKVHEGGTDDRQESA
jgi:segregation and condensation protein A